MLCLFVTLNSFTHTLLRSNSGVDALMCLIFRAVIRSVIHIARNVHFKVYDVFYSLNSHQHVSAETSKCILLVIYIMNIHHVPPTPRKVGSRLPVGAV